MSENDDVYKISEILKSLERIGKEPGRVNAVETEHLSDLSKIKFLINLSPQKIEQTYKAFHITKDLDIGELSNLFMKMFNFYKEKDLALIISHYFKMIAMTISGNNFEAFIILNIKIMR